MKENFSTTESQDKSPNTSLDATYFTYYLIIAAVLGVILNIATIAIIAKGRKTGRGIRIQLISLATADILGAVFLTFSQYFQATSRNQYTDEYICRLILFLGYGCLFVSLLCNTAISLERLMVVFFPFSALRYTQRKKLAVTGCAWLIGLLSELETLVDDVVESKGGTCRFAPPQWAAKTQSNGLLYQWLRVIRYIIPFLIMLISYTLIGCKIRKKSKIREGGESSRTDSANRNAVSLLFLPFSTIS